MDKQPTIAAAIEIITATSPEYGEHQIALFAFAPLRDQHARPLLEKEPVDDETQMPV